MASKTVTRSIQLGPRSHFHRLHSPSLSTEFVTISLSSTSQRRLIIGPFIRRTTENNFQFHLDRACQEHYSRRTLRHLSQRTKNCAPKAIDDRRLFSAKWEIHFHCKEIKSFCLPSEDISENDECNIIWCVTFAHQKADLLQKNGTSLHKSLSRWIIPVVSWSRGRETTTKRPTKTKRNDRSVTN